MVTKNRFLDDLQRGQPAQNLVAKLLDDAGFPSKVDTKARSEWDVVSKHADNILTTEVKFDAYEKKSGNIAIEVYNPRLGKPSGITATKAFFWAHVLSGMVVWITTVSKLKNYLDNNEPERIIDVGGNYNATLYLYPSHRILVDVFCRVDNINTNKLRKVVLSYLGE